MVVETLWYGRVFLEADHFQYMDILKNTIAFLRNNRSDDFIFQTVNDPKHTARVAKQFFEEENITVLP